MHKDKQIFLILKAGENRMGKVLGEHPMAMKQTTD